MIWRCLAVVLLFLAGTAAAAQEPQPASSAPVPAAAASGGAADLAKQLSNPVSSLISVPFQFNFDRGMGPDDDGERYQLNIQPVIPFSISENWNVISRTITPLIFLDDVVPDECEFGLGDITQSFFFTPKVPKGGFIWAVGPAALIPTATDETLGTGKFGLGPTALALIQHKHWTLGALTNHIWSVAGDGGRDDVSSTFLQPFLSYNTKSAWTFTLNSESSYDWKNENWAVPINASVSKLFHIGKQPVSVGGGVRYWAESPDGGPEGFGARLVVTMLFPKK